MSYRVGARDPEACKLNRTPQSERRGGKKVTSGLPLPDWIHSAEAEQLHGGTTIGLRGT
jgi:hypothetical protein